MKNSLEIKLFNPKSVAVLGVSEDLDRIGGLTLHFLLRHGYKGRIYPVNPKYQMIRGLRCYAAVIPEKKDDHGAGGGMPPGMGGMGMGM